MKTFLTATAMVALLAGAPAMAQGTAAQHAASGSAHALSEADRTFLREAGQGNAAEIEMGRLASERAHHGAVKMFGRWMASTHAFAGRELATLTQAMHGTTPPSGPDAETQSMLNRLRGLSGDAFDRAFLEMMAEHHEKDLAVLRRQAQQGGDPAVKAFAMNFAPSVEVHLQQARDLLQDIFHVGPEGQGRAADANLRGPAGSTQPAAPAR